VIDSSYSFLVGPLVAAERSASSSSSAAGSSRRHTGNDRTARRLEKARARGDYGLLVPVAQVRTRDDAEMLRTVLQDAGIRCTLGEAADDGPEAERPGLAVLVFRTDADRARDLVSSRP
jgi:hypothetical protein